MTDTVETPDESLLKRAVKLLDESLKHYIGDPAGHDKAVAVLMRFIATSIEVGHMRGFRGLFYDQKAKKITIDCGWMSPHVTEPEVFNPVAWLGATFRCSHYDEPVHGCTKLCTCGHRCDNHPMDICIGRDSMQAKCGCQEFVDV